MCGCSSACSDDNSWFYIPSSIGDVIYEWLIFFSLSGYRFWQKSIIAICKFNKLNFKDVFRVIWGICLVW